MFRRVCRAARLALLPSAADQPALAPAMRTVATAASTPFAHKGAESAEPRGTVPIFQLPDVEQRCVVVRNLPHDMFGTEIRVWTMRVLGYATEPREDTSAGQTPEDAAASAVAAAAAEARGAGNAGDDVSDPEVEAAAATATKSRNYIERVFVPLSLRKRHAKPVTFVLFRDARDAQRLLQVDTQAAEEEVSASLGRLRGPLVLEKYRPSAPRKSRAEAEAEDLGTTVGSLELDRVLLNPNILYDLQKKHQRRHVLQRHVVDPVFMPPPLDDGRRPRDESNLLREVEAAMRPRRR